jgi:hypothetical protein
MRQSVFYNYFNREAIRMSTFKMTSAGMQWQRSSYRRERTSSSLQVTRTIQMMHKESDA